jgi:predicted MPP superfamily phosphohydrolase
MPRTESRSLSKRLLVAILVAVLGLGAAIAWRDTLAEPVLREATLALPGLPAAAGPLRVVWVSDLHVAGPLNPPARIAALVGRINALRPDVVLLGGDYLGYVWPTTHEYTMREALAPLAGLRARLGVVAILGNHEHDGEPEVRRLPQSLVAPETEGQRELERIGIPVLFNSARRLGPVTIGGRDIEGVGRWGSWQLAHAMGRLGPPYLGITHSPLGADTMPATIPLVLAGHTHCGQIRLPLGDRIAGWLAPLWPTTCGLGKRNGRAMIVTAGVGESRIPLRFRAVRDFWLITLVPDELAPGNG